MQSLLIGLVIVLFCVTIVFLCVAVFSFGSLMQWLQRKAPKYYKNIGRPYTWPTSDDISVRQGGVNKSRGRAWRKYIVRLSKKPPATFPKEAAAQQYARLYRWAIRGSLVALVGFVVTVLAAGGLLVEEQPTIEAAGGTTVRAGKAPAEEPVTTTEDTVTTTTDVTPATPTVIQTEIKYTTPSTGVSGSLYIKPSSPTSALPVLTRADMTNVYESIAPVGQQKSDKIQVCEQLTTRNPVASDLAPAGQPICTEVNLSTYSTY